MKRIVISLLFGLLCSLLYLAVASLKNKKGKGSLMDVLESTNTPTEVEQTLYKGTLKLTIGNPEAPGQQIKKTLDQIAKRLDDHYAGINFDSSYYILQVRSVQDTSYIRKSLTESVNIEFKEVFTLGQISELITKANEELKKADSITVDKEKVYLKKLEVDTAKEKLSTIMAENELTDLSAKPGLAKFIEFSQSYQMPETGQTRFLAELGYVKARDTMELTTILNRPEIISHFPETLTFAYGSTDNDNDPYKKDSILKIFALKHLDKRYTPYPTDDQVTNAEMVIEPPTGNPVIAMEFNDAGAQAWYFMTKRNVNKPIAMLANNFVLSAPFVESPIEGGKSRITGGFTVAECRYLSKMMMSEDLAQPVKIVETKFTAESSNKFKRLMIPGIIFFFTSVLAYGLSLIVKPSSKP